MNHRKDDVITSDGPGPGYTQRITRTTSDGRDSEVTYYDGAGREIPAPVAPVLVSAAAPLKPVVAADKV
jgi:hypothetical protein